MTLKRTLLAAIVAVGSMAMFAEDASAFFGRLRGGGGSCGSWGGGYASGGSWGGGSWGGGSWGGGHSSCGSWGGGYASGGSWGGGYGSYGGGYAVSYGGGHYVRSGIVRDRVIASRPVVDAQLPAVKTRLTLRVPAEAKVTLAGVETKQAGEVRQFATTRLAAGQVWDDYKVVVEMDQNGQTVREERTIKLVGGRPQELEIGFNAPQQLAQR